jgi:hypothetical protein
MLLSEGDYISVMVNTFLCKYMYVHLLKSKVLNSLFYSIIPFLQIQRIQIIP